MNQAKDIADFPPSPEAKKAVESLLCQTNLLQSFTQR